MARTVIRKASGQINVSFPSSVIPPSTNHMLSAKYNDSRALDAEQHVTLKRVMYQLDRLVGLQHVKDFVFEIYAWLYITQCRREKGLKTSQQTLHMVFKGNPGTGKTTVARILGNLFQEMGVLTKGHLIEVERADLVGEYIGHTAQKTKEAIKKALGGILFIDEAYSLARGGEKDFGKEAIDTLVKGMEDHKDHFVLILAGYPYEMEDFLASNPGLPSRFPLQMEFHDYSVPELVGIAEMMVEEREYRLSEQAKQKLKQHMYLERQRSPHNFSNARFVRNLIEKAIREHAVRLVHQPQHTRADLVDLSSRDFKLH